MSSQASAEDSLDSWWQDQRILLDIPLDIVNQSDFPSQPLDLPYAETEGDKGDEDDEDVERSKEG